MVNQASMTGESVPVRKTKGSYAYAGTVIEEGECHIIVEKEAGSGRYDRIVKMIEESEKLKSSTEDKASHLDGGFFLRIEAINACCSAFCNAGSRKVSYFR